MSAPSVAGRRGTGHDVLVVIPAWNEERSVGTVVEEVRALGYATLVVDDGSVDRTAETAERAGATVLRLPVNLGVGGALRCGFRYAVSEGYGVVVQCDADGQHDPTEIARLLDAMRSTGADLVVGSRFADPTSDFRVGAVRKMAMHHFAHLASRRARASITDATSGFRAIRGSLLGSFAASYPAEYLGDTIEALVRAGRAGNTVVEIGVHMRPRAAGVSSATTLASIWYLVRVRCALWLQSHRPADARRVQMTLWERGVT
ncbi:MAG TPA: glycosyltransferase family 2 protein [Acidimicrobiia bacterium]|jgi:glycosyltransferase involved in cell wall biosynthesis